MKAVMAYVENDQFHLVEITDVDKATDEPKTVSIATVDGVRSIRFKISNDPGSMRKFIEVRLLVMGDSHDANHAQTMWTRLHERWDELTGTDAGTYFEEFVSKWRVRNLGERFED